MSVGDQIYETKLYSRDGGGNFFQNVQHWLVAEDSADDAFGNALQLIEAFMTGWDTKLAALMSSDSNIDAIYGRKIGPSASGNTATKSINLGGTIVKEVQTGAVAVNFNLITENVKQHGHFYLGGVPQDMFVDDAIASAYSAQLTALRTEMLTQLTWGGTGTADLAVYSKKLHTALPVEAIAEASYAAVLKRRVKPFG